MSYGNGGSGGEANANFLVSRSQVTQILDIHDGLVTTETTIFLGTASNDDVSIQADGMVIILNDLITVQLILEVHVAKTTGGQLSVYSSWVEVSVDAGVNWAPVEDSLRVETMAKDGASVFVSELSIDTPIPTGAMFRLRAANTGSAAIEIHNPTPLLTSNGSTDGFATKITARTIT